MQHINCINSEFEILKKIDFLSTIVKILHFLSYRNINAKDNKGYTPLHIAAGNNLPAMVIALLAKGASTTILDNNGKTAKQVAAYLGYTTIVNIIP